MLRHWEGIGSLELLAVRVVKDLLDSGHGIAVLDQDVHLVVANGKGRQAAVGRGQQPGRVARGCKYHC